MGMRRPKMRVLSYVSEAKTGFIALVFSLARGIRYLAAKY